MERVYRIHLHAIDSLDPAYKLYIIVAGINFDLLSIHLASIYPSLQPFLSSLLTTLRIFFS